MTDIPLPSDLEIYRARRSYLIRALLPLKKIHDRKVAFYKRKHLQVEMAMARAWYYLPRDSDTAKSRYLDLLHIAASVEHIIFKDS